MRWKTDSKPKYGDTRIKRKFAWLPVKIDEYTVWLERYQITETLVMVYSSDLMDDTSPFPHLEWKETKKDYLVLSGY